MFETKEQVLEKVLSQEKPHCPHCGVEMNMWEVPPIPVGDGLGWGTPYLFLCFNDDCKLYKEGWENLMENYSHHASYRCMNYPGTQQFELMPVFSPVGGTGQIIDSQILAQEEVLKENTKEDSWQVSGGDSNPSFPRNTQMTEMNHQTASDTRPTSTVWALRRLAHLWRHHRWLIIDLLCILALLIWPGTTGAVPRAGAPTPSAQLAAQHLAAEIDRYHSTFDVYTDVGAGGNHFVHRARSGNSVTIDDTHTGTVHSGATAIRNTFSPATATDWGGWFFQNGVLLPGAMQPTDNWGTHPDAGYDLRGATSLTFWARGAAGGERVEFFAFGANGGPYGDSAPKVTPGGYVTLQPTWQLYTIPLTGLDLGYIITGFGWVTNAPENGDRPIVFYLDDIRYNLARSDALRLPVSYVTLPVSEGFDMRFRNVAFTYDAAVALSALVAHGDQPHARALADAFGLRVSPRSFPSGRPHPQRLPGRRPDQSAGLAADRRGAAARLLGRRRAGVGGGSRTGGRDHRQPGLGHDRPVELLRGLRRGRLPGYHDRDR